MSILGTGEKAREQVFGSSGYILSGLVREKTEAKDHDEPNITTETIPDLIKKYPVPDVNSVRAKAEKLLLRIRDRSKKFGEMITLDYATDYPMAYAQDSNEFIALIELLQEEKLIHSIGDDSATNSVSVTAKGWDLVRSLRGTNPNSEQGFVAIWFHPDMKDSTLAIETAIQEAGFTSVCISEEHFSEKIMDKALGEIRKSRFIVVDLTGGRNSVFFEAGFAFGLGIEAIYVYQKGAEKETSLEFYVRHYKCYDYADATELREKLRDAIKARIKKINSPN